MRAALGSLLAVVLVVGVAPTVGGTEGARAVDGLPTGWEGQATMVPGTARYDAEEWAYTDYVYDDGGAGGDFAYPEDAERYGANAADVALLRVEADGGAVHHLVELNTLLVPDSTVVALAVDTDLDETTGGGDWPLGADITSAGWEFVVTVWGTDGELTFADGTTHSIPVAASTETNTIEFAIPTPIADRGTGAWRYRGAAGVWDPDAGTWAEVVASDPAGSTADQPTGGDGSTNQPDAFNLLFRNRAYDGGTAATDENDSSGFQSERQSEALASGDIGPFTRTVHFGLLASGATAAPEPPPGDVHTTRIYAPEDFPNARPEGVSDDGATGSLYNGRFQPYRLFVPGSYRQDPTPAPLIPMLHGWTGNHRGFNPSDDAFWNDVVRANRALVPKPLGRGEEIWYEHLGELDVLGVMDDVARHYAVDPDRIYLGGTSMGGLGTIKIASSHPDLFAGIFPSVPPMSDRAQGYVLPQNNDWDLVDVADSLRNVPVRNFTGTYDALVPAGYDSKRFCDRLEELVYDHICWRDVSSDGTHQSYHDDFAADVLALMEDHPQRVEDPARVTYASHPAFRRHAADAGVADLLPYDHAYWVRGIEWPEPPADELTRGTVPDWPTDPGTPRKLVEGDGVSSLDVRTYGLGVGEPVPHEVPDDDSPTIVRRGTTLESGPEVSPENAFDLEVTRVLGLTLELDRMGLSLDAPLTGDLSGDGSFRLELTPAPADGCSATFGGEPVSVESRNGSLMVDLELAPEATELRVDCG